MGFAIRRCVRRSSVRPGGIRNCNRCTWPARHPDALAQGVDRQTEGGMPSIRVRWAGSNRWRPLGIAKSASANQHHGPDAGRFFKPSRKAVRSCPPVESGNSNAGDKSSIRRNGVDDGHAPTQMPHAVQGPNRPRPRGCFASIRARRHGDGAETNNRPRNGCSRCSWIDRPRRCGQGPCRCQATGRHQQRECANASPQVHAGRQRRPTHAKQEKPVDGQLRRHEMRIGQSEATLRARRVPEQRRLR